MHQNYIQTVCLANYTAQQIKDLNEELDLTDRLYFGWLSLPTASLALLFAGLYSVVVYRAVHGRQVSRKCYVLLLNRALGDIVCCLAAIIGAIYVLCKKHPNRDLVFVFENFFMASVWSAMVSYVSLSAIKLYAVWQPLHYRKIFIMRRCIYVALLSWFIFVSIIFFTQLMAALVKIPSLNEWSGCRLETCLRIVFVVRHYLVVAIYFFTMFAFILTIILIKRAEKFAKKYSKGSFDKEEKRSRFPLWKLSCNVATFAGLTVFYVIYSIFLLSKTDRCFFQQHNVPMIRWLGIVRCALMVRILIDPLISFFADHQIRYSLISVICPQRKTTSSSMRSYLKRFSENAFNSSVTLPPRGQNRTNCDAPQDANTKMTEII